MSCLLGVKKNKNDELFFKYNSILILLAYWVVYWLSRNLTDFLLWLVVTMSASTNSSPETASSWAAIVY